MCIRDRSSGLWPTAAATGTKLPCGPGGSYARVPENQPASPLETGSAGLSSDGTHRTASLEPVASDRAHIR
eukprot:3868633-Pyramimonas_sp.AAC.1